MFRSPFSSVIGYTGPCRVSTRAAKQKEHKSKYNHEKLLLDPKKLHLLTLKTFKS